MDNIHPNEDESDKEDSSGEESDDESVDMEYEVDIISGFVSESIDDMDGEDEGEEKVEINSINDMLTNYDALFEKFKAKVHYFFRLAVPFNVYLQFNNCLDRQCDCGGVESLTNRLLQVTAAHLGKTGGGWGGRRERAERGHVGKVKVRLEAVPAKQQEGH